VKDAPHEPTQIEEAPHSKIPAVRRWLDDLFTDALMHRVDREDKPWRGRGRHAKAKRQRAKAKRAKGRVVKSIRKRANRRPY
jgi:hypothetical protein